MRCALYCMVLVSISAGACQCGATHHPPVSTIRELRSLHINNLGDKDVVIEGVVERQVLRSDASLPSDRMWQNYRIVTVRATAVYRGPKQERFEVKTGLGGGDCGFDFETGESYLIYATRNDKGTLLTDMCSHTSLAEGAGPDGRILRGEPPSPDDLLDQDTYLRKFRSEHMSSVCGRVNRSDGTPVTRNSVYLSRVRHDGFPPQQNAALLKADGSFCLEYTRQGAYVLSAEDYDQRTGTRFVGTRSKIRVEAGKDISDVNLVLHRDLFYRMQKHLFADCIVAGATLFAAGLFWVMLRGTRRPS